MGWQGHGLCPLYKGGVVGLSQPTGSTNMKESPAVGGHTPLPIRELQINILPALHELCFPSGSLFSTGRAHP